VFPTKVNEVAQKRWEEITVTEPAKHRRLRKVVKDGEETVPTKYQTMTNDECYQSFKESCTQEIGFIMKEHARQIVQTHSKRPDSTDKQWRLKYATEELPRKFPSLSWFVDQRPAEVKMMHDHTTGLCKVIISRHQL
jgi:hypothetical protein